MIIAIGQINPIIGDFAANRAMIIEAAETARKDGARLIVFPELSLCGYPPMDLLEHESFIRANEHSLRRLQHELPSDIAATVGFVERTASHSGKAIHNSAAVLFDGKCIFSQAKTLLPTYDVFDEARYFQPAAHRRVFTLDGECFGIAICEDLWWEKEPVRGTRYPVDPVRELLDLGAQTILCPSASPFSHGKMDVRTELIRRVGDSRAAVVYCNMVGANDNLIFDGTGMISNRAGKIIRTAPRFATDVTTADMESSEPVSLQAEDRNQSIYAALTLGIRDYMQKSGFQKAHLGLSGGVDSALTAALACEALGAENLTCFLLPSQYTSQGSIEDAQRLAQNLGAELHTIPITSAADEIESGLYSLFEGLAPDTTEENIQARIRGTMLMAYSNKFRSLLLTTGNKSELAVGYCTLYGDMAGSLAVLGDVLKTEVYELCRWINRTMEIIPETVLAKPPSAELRPEQTDQDSLPEYHVLDAILTRYVMENRSAEEIAAEGFPTAAVQHVVRLIAGSEYKRRQAPPVLKVSAKAFGTGRRIPLARSLFEI